MRRTKGKMNMELFPVAVLAHGRYRVAQKAIREGEVPSNLSVGSTFTLYRRGREIGSFAISKSAHYVWDFGNYHFGQGKWTVDRRFYPTLDARFHLPAERRISQDVDYRDKQPEGEPVHVFLAINAKRKRATAVLPMSAGERKRVGNAMTPLARKLAVQRQITPKGLRIASLQSFDVDGDGTREYAGLFRVLNGDNPVSSVFLIGQMRGRNFVPQYVEPSGELAPTPFDVLDIDGDGKQEIFCELQAYEDQGFMILSKVNGRFSPVFNELMFGP